MKLNLAAGPWVVPGWVTVDFDKHFKPDILHDLTVFPYPFDDESVQYIFSSHWLEHLSYKNARLFLAECFRILEPGGAIRLSVPDFLKAIQRVVSGEFNEWYKHLIEKEEMVNLHETPIVALAKEFFYPGIENDGVTYHKSAWDHYTLKYFLSNAGFSLINISSYRASSFEDFRVKCLDNRPEHSLFIEGVKR